MLVTNPKFRQVLLTFLLTRYFSYGVNGEYSNILITIIIHTWAIIIKFMNTRVYPYIDVFFLGGGGVWIFF